MPSWNPFKRRKPARAQAPVEHWQAEPAPPASPRLDYGSIRSVDSRQLSPVGERLTSPEPLPSVEHTRTRMYDMPRRAPFGINVKYKGPPPHAWSPTASPVPERYESPLSAVREDELPPVVHDEREVMFADEPEYREQPQLSPVEPQKPTKSRRGFFSIFRFRRKSKKVKEEEAGPVVVPREFSPVPTGTLSPSGRKRLTKKGVCQCQFYHH